MPKVRQATVAKYLYALNQIRFNIVELGNNKSNLSKMCRELNLSKSAGTEIVKSGIIKKIRSKDIGTHYVWNTILPNEKMARELISRAYFRCNQGMMKKNIEQINDTFIISENETILNTQEKDLTLSERIVSAFPNNTLLEIKLAIDKLLTDKIK